MGIKEQLEDAVKEAIIAVFPEKRDVLERGVEVRFKAVSASDRKVSLVISDRGNANILVTEAIKEVAKTIKANVRGTAQVNQPASAILEVTISAHTLEDLVDSVNAALNTNIELERAAGG